MPFNLDLYALEGLTDDELIAFQKAALTAAIHTYDDNTRQNQLDLALRFARMRQTLQIREAESEEK